MQNDKGQGVSHATGESSVPGKVQEKVPSKLEHELPDVSILVHPAFRSFWRAILADVANIHSLSMTPVATRRQAK